MDYKMEGQKIHQFIYRCNNVLSKLPPSQRSEPVYSNHCKMSLIENPLEIDLNEEEIVASYQNNWSLNESEGIWSFINSPWEVQPAPENTSSMQKLHLSLRPVSFLNTLNKPKPNLVADSLNSQSAPLEISTAAEGGSAEASPEVLVPATQGESDRVRRLAVEEVSDQSSASDAVPVPQTSLAFTPAREKGDRASSNALDGEKTATLSLEKDLDRNAISPLQKTERKKIDKGRDNDLTKFNANAWFIQVISLKDEESVKRMHDQNPADGAAAICYEATESERCALVFGPFISISEAQEARRRLPAFYKAEDSFLRTTRSYLNMFGRLVPLKSPAT